MNYLIKLTLFSSSIFLANSCAQGEFAGGAKNRKAEELQPDETTTLGGEDSVVVTKPDSTVEINVGVTPDDGESITATCSDPFVAITIDPGETDKVISNPMPACFAYVSAVCVGAGGGGERNGDDASGGGGGALAWFHNKTFVSTDVYKGSDGVAGTPGVKGGDSIFKINDQIYLTAAGGGHGTAAAGGTGGKFTLTSSKETGVDYGGGNGGNGGRYHTSGGRISAGGGGGAGGYEGKGGNGANNVERGNGGAGKGGAGGGGGAGCEQAGKGGGVGLFGKGSDGAGGGHSGRCKSDERGKTGFHGSHFKGIAVYGGGASGQSERGIIPADSGKCRIIFSKERWNWLSKTE